MAEPTLKKMLSLGGGIAIALIVFGYGIWISRDLLFGITNKISGISDGMTTKNGILEFSGVAKHANNLTIDGRTVPLSDDGTWTNTLALLPGYNTIQIQVTDRFKRIKTKEYKVYYQNN
jgi:hypothetical protein